jgi:GxxExxY protein
MARQSAPPIPIETERLAKAVLDAAFAVHTELGAGLLESAYEACLSFELNARGTAHQCQVELPVTYRGQRVDAGYRLDMLVNNDVIVELKSVESLLPVDEAQLLTYLKLSGLRLGLLLNFNVPHLKDGIRRIVL